MVKYLKFKTALIFISLLAVLWLPIPVLAANKTCLTDELLQVNRTYYVDVDGTITPIEVTKEIYCPFGCSATLNDCRVDSFMEIIEMATIFAGLLLFSALSIWLERKTNTSIDIPLLILTSLFSIIIGTQDIFADIYRMLFLLFSIIPLVLLWFSRREEAEDAAGEPIEVEVED